jgi:hypothetical protein
MQHKTNLILLPKHMYHDFLMMLQRDNPGSKILKVVGSRRVGAKNLISAQGKILMTFDRWYHIMTIFAFEVRARIIDGYRFDLGANLGNIHGSRIERNFHNRQLNWVASRAKGMYQGPDGKMKFKHKVYYTAEDYCRISWSKPRGKFEIYKFSPTSATKSGKGFKEQFSNALIKNPALKLKYPYYQLSKCNTVKQA